MNDNKKYNKVNLPLLKSHRVLAPRIGYIITTINNEGKVNAAVFSNLTSVSTDPERIVMGVYKPWDTIKNLRQVKEFVVNLPSKDLMEQVWICGDKHAGNPIPYGVDELEIAGLTAIPSEKVKPPRIAECYAHLECKMLWMKDVGDHYLILGEVVCGSFTKGYMDENYVIDIDKCLPLMEISWNRFTYAKEIMRTDNEKIKSKVKKALADRRVKVSKKLREYEKWAENKN